jgi:hypothetical protein
LDWTVIRSCSALYSTLLSSTLLYTTVISSHRISSHLYTHGHRISPPLIRRRPPMALASQESTGPTLSLSKVPSIKQLSELLGIQHASLKESTVFMDAIHAFRKSCITIDGSPVTTLVDWNSPTVQRELRTAAIKFLDDDGNGVRFWRPSRSWAQPSDLHYPKHRDT